MEKIPVIGTPIVNSPHWLYKLVMSVDYPTSEFVIINNNGRGEISKELDNLCELNHKYIDKIKVCHLPANIGCGGAWNLIIKSYMMCPYWVITSNDVSFSPGFLETMIEASKDPEVGIVKPEYLSFEVFLIKDWVVDKYGLFDENLYPAYAEDLDYLMRFIVDPIKEVHIGKNFLHGDKSYEESGSQTWRSDMSLKYTMDNSRIINENEYMKEKWGPTWRYPQPYSHPFNIETNDISVTKYKLNFVRRKYTGF
jgi:hypothetical protein